MILLWALRAVGASLLVLSVFHAFLWKNLNWGDEIKRLSPLSARVFAVHTFFIAFVLFALGLLSLVRADLLLAPSELGRLMLVGVVLFWLVRLALQPLVFDAVMGSVWATSRFLRAGASVVWVMYVAVYGCALAVQSGADPGTWMKPLDFAAPLTWARVFIAGVWILFGLVFKALDGVPRHRRIVARVVGEAMAPTITLGVALSETSIGLWMLSGRALATCALVQTLMIASMNALELRYARDLLLSPVGMLCANALLLSAGWYVALAGA